MINYEKSSMSNNRPPKSPPPPSKTSSTPTTEDRPPEKPAFDGALAMEVLQKLSAELDERRAEMASLRDFHRTLEGATQDDLRIYWDVRIVRGKDTAFHSVKGISTLPNILSDKMLAHAPTMVQREVMDKIAEPLTAVFMREGELRQVAGLTLLETSPAYDVHPTEHAGGSDSVNRVADEIGDDDQGHEGEEEMDADEG